MPYSIILLLHVVLRCDIIGYIKRGIYMERKTGDSAYPVISHGVVMSEGMSLRDYFAGHAIIGLMSQAERGLPILFSEISESAYGLADAMLKERNRD